MSNAVHRILRNCALSPREAWSINQISAHARIWVLNSECFIISVTRGMGPLLAGVAIVVLGALLGAFRGHYIFALTLAMVGCYEFTAPLLFLMPEHDVARNAMVLYAEYASDQVLSQFAYGLLSFVLLVILAYSGGSWYFSSRFLERRTRGGPFHWHGIFALAVLLFGFVSMWTGAGQARLEDYSGIGLQTEYSRYFSYGGLLLVVCVGLLLNRAAAGQWLAVTLIGLCMAPLLIELFIAGRRQLFAPSAFLILALVLYSNLRHKALVTIGFGVMVAVLFGFQFALREEIQQTDLGGGGESILFAILGPQIVEFVAINATTLYAWNFFVLHDSAPTLGSHWAFHALNSVPFTKLGDSLFPKYSAELYDVYGQLAPWGGLSTLADVLYALSWAGVPVLAMLLGICCSFAHYYSRQAFRHAAMPGDARSIYVLSLIATLVPKYRSGIGDMIQTTVSFSILYWAIAVASYLLLTLIWTAIAGRTSLGANAGKVL
jgi:oligosaccharide repeat unit polymerase